VPDRIRELVKPLASLKLTVVLMALAIFLIFAGTWAQIDLGLWKTLDTYFRTWFIVIPFRIFLPRSWDVPGGLPYPGGYVIGIMLLVNLIAAHAVRFKFNRRRIGIILIHLSIILLLIGEGVTAMYALETQMPIFEGESSNWTHDVREAEIAVIDHSDPDKDRVISIPEKLLVTSARSRTPISHPQLPFDIQVDQWMINSNIERLGPHDGKPRQATEGLGQSFRAIESRQVTGVSDQSVNVPSAVVSLSGNGEDLGSYLLSVNFAWDDYRFTGQDVATPDGKYAIYMRFRRYYKPYTIALDDFKHDLYIGTNTPKNFSSDVRLIDPVHNENRTVKIYMNNPLRYRGETFFQSGWLSDDRGTVLQVVDNPGWTLPYIACTVGGIGMCIHFGMLLAGFLRRNDQRELPKDTPALAPWLARYTRLTWPILAAMAIGCIAVPLLKSTPSNTTDPLRQFSQLPVVDQGRIKPMDTLARVTLMVLSNKQSFYLDGDAGSSEKSDLDNPQRTGATRWLLDVMTRAQSADEYKVFRVDHPEVLAVIGQTQDRKYFSFNEIMANRANLAEQLRLAAETPEAQRTAFHDKLRELSSHVGLYDSLRERSIFDRFFAPPDSPDGQWLTLADAVEQARGQDNRDPAVASLLDALFAWQSGEPGDFRAAVSKYQSRIAAQIPGVVNNVRFEAMFNRFAPFKQAAALYVIAFLLGVFSWLVAPKRLATAAFWVLMVALTIHSFGTLARIVIQARPPVTNLYSSAVFISLGCVVMGAILERIYHNGVGAVMAAVTGFLCLIVAHNLALDGDTMTMMQAVLDTNFWLATHVTVITIGYSATFLAGFLGGAYLLWVTMLNRCTDEQAKNLSRMIYGILCFAVLTSFVGTILGGIWADQSWGRFWGWDPKENGAAIIVLWTALVLHARWGGIAKARGIAALAVAGNIITAWSWFGTNLLGVGLHSYGFMEGTMFWLLVWVFLNLGWIAAAYLIATLRNRPAAVPQAVPEG
jgi:ABC-type transport system involved in cytochrome c biogenesis permease subunit